MTPKTAARIALAGAVFSFGFTAPAEAHLVSTRLGDFYGGALHPLTDVANLIAWLALVVLASLQGVEKARWLVLAVPLAVLGGALSSFVLPHASWAEPTGIAAVALLGLAIAADVAVPLPVLLGTSTAVAALFGFINAAATTAETDHVLFISGLTATSYIIPMLGLGGCRAFLDGEGGWRKIALRAGGSWMAAIGVMVLGFVLRSHVSA